MSPVQWKIQQLMAQITKFAAAWTFPQLLEQPGWTQGAPMNLIKPDKNPQKKQLMGSFARSPPVINFVHWRSGAGEQLGQGRADGISSLPFSSSHWSPCTAPALKFPGPEQLRALLKRFGGKGLGVLHPCRMQELKKSQMNSTEIPFFQLNSSEQGGDLQPSECI